MTDTDYIRDAQGRHVLARHCTSCKGWQIMTVRYMVGKRYACKCPVCGGMRFVDTFDVEFEHRLMSLHNPNRVIE